MEKPYKTIKLNYPDEARFLKDYRFIQKGKLAVPMPDPPEAGKLVCLKISVPHLDGSFSFPAIVQKSVDKGSAKKTGKKPGIIVSFTEESEETAANLKKKLLQIDSYSKALANDMKASEKGGNGDGKAANNKAPPTVKKAVPPPPPPPPIMPEKPAAQENKAEGTQPRSANLEPPPPPPPRPGPKKAEEENAPAAPPAPATTLEDETVHEELEEITPLSDGDEEVAEDAVEETAGPQDVKRVVLKSSPAQKEKPPDKPREKAPPEQEQPQPEGTPGPAEPAPQAPVKIRPHKAKVAEVKKKSEKTQSAIELEWIRGIINQSETEQEEEEKPAYEAPPSPEKKQLTAEERARVQPAGEFIMDLTKAMQRSGYYSHDHPESKGAKHGLYEQLQKAIADGKELMITNQETREKTDILITGVLDGPVSIRTVVGPGMAEMFVPRLRDYFNRKGLVSFALKKDISQEHFSTFIDIMSDPQVDQGSEAGVGALLTNALVENGINEISTVFMDDMLILEEKFPWRVEMAIQRLAKDLKVLPMFKDKSEQELRAMKYQTVMDIIRPLLHPEFLKDILINTYIIARHVKTLDLKELEALIIETFPDKIVLPTAEYVLEEMKRLQEKAHEHADSKVLSVRINSVKRILKNISRRVVMEEIKGAGAFLEALYFNNILTMEELPAEVRARVNTLNLAESVKSSAEDYAEAIAATGDPDEANVLLECFKRVVPVMIEKGSWPELLIIIKGVNKAAGSSRLFQGGEGLPAMPLIYIFGELAKELAAAYMEADKESRPLLDEMVSYLGPTGVSVMGEVLLRSNDRGVRKAAVESLVKMKAMSLQWVRSVLDDSTQPWYLQRNAILVLSRIARDDEDKTRARRFLTNSRPRLREEALTAVLRLEGKNAEKAIFNALDDPDKKVQGRAASSLNVIQPLSDSAVEEILKRLRVSLSKDREEAKEQALKMAPLVRALANLRDVPRFDEIEDALVELLQTQSGGAKKGFFKRLRNVFEEEESPVLLQALIDCVGRIGGEKSLEVLDPLLEAEGDIGNRARQAAGKIRLRQEQGPRPSEG